MVNFHIITLFPEFFDSALKTGLMQKAIEDGIVNIDFRNPRDFSHDRHRHVDDRPYGGGPGMVMQVEPIAAALNSLPTPGILLSMAPNGYPASQELISSFVKQKDITILCGRYEGYDARIYERYPFIPVSVGDIVLNGGEVAALAVVEAVSRLVPGFMGKLASGDDESFSDNTLEYPQYTRPPVWEGIPVPDILSSGDHSKIADWRRKKSLENTLRYRPDLLSSAVMNSEDAEYLSTLENRSCASNISLCIVHYPVSLGKGKVGTSSVNSINLHDIARVVKSYSLGRLYVVTPISEQRELMNMILQHWDYAGQRGHEDRSMALKTVSIVGSLEDVVDDIAGGAGEKPFVVGTTAKMSKKMSFMTPLDVRKVATDRKVLLLLGTAQGLSAEILKKADGLLRPLRFFSFNHLSVRSAAAIIIDRIVGDFY